VRALEATARDHLSRPYGQSRAAPNGFVYACREHLSATREGEIQEREKDHWPKGGLR